jgi:hypothetical protein
MTRSGAPVGRRSTAPPGGAEIRALGQKGANEPFALGRIYGSRVSRYSTGASEPE